MADFPTSAAQRLPLLDSLRGFALSGVLLANLVAFSLYYFLPPEDGARLPSFRLDRWLDPALNVFVTGKFITLFSLLFGVGFAMQMQRDTGTRAGMTRYARRLGILLVIGLVHALLWWGDILRYYAVLGLALLLAWRLRPWQLALAGVLLSIVPYPVFPAFAATTRAISESDANAAALAAFANPQWSVMLQGNLDFNQWWFVDRWGMVLTVTGRLLIGVALGKCGVFQGSTTCIHFWKRLSMTALPLGLILSVLLQLSYYGLLPIAPLQTTTAKLLDHVATLSLGLGYMAGFAVVFALPSWQPILRMLAPVGRMALSNYLMQTILGITLFYGVGLALGPRYGLAGVLVTWLILFSALVAFSRWWLVHYRFGPAEWLWRSLTYGHRQPMRLASP